MLIQLYEIKVNNVNNTYIILLNEISHFQRFMHIFLMPELFIFSLGIDLGVDKCLTLVLYY